MVTRRRLLALTGAGVAGSSAAALVVACGGDGDGGGGAAAPVPGVTTEIQPEGTAGSADVVVLNRLLDMENRSVAAYKELAPSLSGRELATAKELLTQEQEHADRLAEAVRQLGARPNKPAARYDFPRVRNRRGALNFALSVENEAIAAYLDALPRLSSPDLRGSAAAIVTTEAEHASVLLGELGRPQVPSAFVTGRAAP